MSGCLGLMEVIAFMGDASVAKLVVIVSELEKKKNPPGNNTWSSSL